MDSVLAAASCLNVLDELGRYSPYLRISVTLGGELILRPVPVDGYGNPIPDVPVDDLFSRKAQG
ncbi:MAG: hypothetical protein IJL42_10575 [Bacteroidales bacterium]|nr:hypothetical protein [Bacteroidales bacterium]